MNKLGDHYTRTTLIFNSCSIDCVDNNNQDTLLQRKRGEFRLAMVTMILKKRRRLIDLHVTTVFEQVKTALRSRVLLMQFGGGSQSAPHGYIL